MSERKPAYPTHTQDMHGDEDDGPLAQPDHMVVSDDEDDQPLARPASRKNLRKFGVAQLLITETLHPWFLQDLVQLYQCEEEKDLLCGKTQLPHWNKRCQETRVIEQRTPRFWAKRQNVKLSATLPTSCLTNAT